MDLCPVYAGSVPGRPVFDHQVGHREIPRVTGCQPGSHPPSRGGDEAVGLAERDSLEAEGSSRIASPFCLYAGQGGDVHAVQQLHDGRFFAGPQASGQFFDVEGEVKGISPGRCRPRSRCAAGRPRSASMRTVVSSSIAPVVIGCSADPPGVAGSLGPHPPGRVLIPIVTVGGDAPQGSLDFCARAFVVEHPADGLGNKCTPMRRPIR